MAFKRETFRSLIQTLTGVATIWAHRKEPFVSPTEQALVRLNVLSSTLEMMEWRRPGEGGQRTTTTANIYKISVWCKAYGNTEAHDILDDLVLALFDQSSQDYLTQNDLSVLDVGQVLDLNGTEDNRELSVAQVDLTVRGVNNKVDATSAGETIDNVTPLKGYYERFEITGNVTIPRFNS